VSAINRNYKGRSGPGALARLAPHRGGVGLHRRASRAYTPGMFAVGAWVAAGLLARAWVLGRLPMWDAAGNGWGAVELWAALVDGRVVDFAVRLNAQDKWPFGFSLLMLPFVAAGGGSFESAALLPALAFALVPALLVWAGRESVSAGAGAGIAAGFVAGALWLASPLPRALATVAMRETTGAALAVAVLAAYLRARRRGTLGAWRLAAGLLLALFFVKYNYFLLNGAALALHAVLEMKGDRRRAILSDLVGRVRRGGWRSPPRWAALALAAAAAIFLAGENPGNFLYGCLVVATVLGLSLQWKSLDRLRGALARLSPAARGFVEWLLVPLWLWSLSPRPIHPRSLFAFLRNRPGDLPPLSLESLAFYPRSLFAHYLDLGAAAWIAAACAVAGLTFVARRADPVRAVALTAAVGALGVAAHPMREDRFLATAFPAIALLAALVAARGVARLLPRAPGLRAAVAVLLTACGLTAIWVSARGVGAFARLERDHRLLTAGPEMLAPLTAAAFWASEPSAGRVGLLGGLNEISESAVRWEAWRGHGADPEWVEPVRGLDGGSSPGEVALRVDRWLSEERPDRVVVVQPMTGSRWLADADYRRYNAWQVLAVERLESSLGWRREQARELPELGLELRVLDRVAP
jgi:hypothetical protein